MQTPHPGASSEGLRGQVQGSSTSSDPLEGLLSNPSLSHVYPARFVSPLVDSGTVKMTEILGLNQEARGGADIRLGLPSRSESTVEMNFR